MRGCLDNHHTTALVAQCLQLATISARQQAGAFWMQYLQPQLNRVAGLWISAHVIRSFIHVQLEVMRTSGFVGSPSKALAR